MGRVEKRMYRRASKRRLMIRLMLALTMIVIVLGLILRQQRAGLSAQHVPQPTQTPVARSFDESIVKREIALEECRWYAIQTGIYSTREAAAEKVNLYAQRGAPGYVNQDGEKWRVLIACYGEKNDASAVRERLSASQGVETYLHTWACPAITLRLTGMAGQVDVVESGLTLLLNAASILRDDAARLDGGEASLQQAGEAIAALDGQISLWLETAQARFTRPYPQLLETLLSDAQGWSKHRAAMQGAHSATELSAQMKLAAMALFDRCCQMRKSLME